MTDNPKPPPRAASPNFRPMAMISLLYLVFFFFAIGMLLVVPELLHVLKNVPPGPAQQEITEKMVRETIRPRLPIALVLAVAATAGGTYLEILPGLRNRG